MFYTNAARFDMTENIKKFLKILETKQGLSSPKNQKLFKILVTLNLTAHA